jgi:hypothetical protein
MIRGDGGWLVAAIPASTSYNIGLVLLVVAVAAATIWGYRVWREINDDLKPATTDELLESFHQARAEGELEDEEFDRVRERIEEIGRTRTGDHG